MISCLKINEYSSFVYFFIGNTTLVVLLNNPIDKGIGVLGEVTNLYLTLFSSPFSNSSFQIFRISRRGFKFNLRGGGRKVTETNTALQGTFGFYNNEKSRGTVWAVENKSEPL